ncbi:MAG: ABC transporter ATP-binding protein [Candidatus Thorarchaeota archaeon]
MIEIESLTHIYSGEAKALDDLTFQVEKGTIIGLLGPNGAGKSTCVKMITGLLKPTSGTVKVGGFSVSDNLSDIRKLIGFMPQETALYQDLTAQEALEYHADIYGVPKEMKDERIASMLELAGLTHRKDDLVKTYSGGMKRRLALVRALLHDSELLILDEMSLGVDVQSRSLIWQQVKDLKAQGKTVLFCTNYMDEADEIADKLFVLDHGALVAEGTPAELKQKYMGTYLIETQIEGLNEEQDASWLSNQLGLKVDKLSEDEERQLKTAWIQSEEGYKDLPNAIKTLSDLGFVVKQAAMREPSLGDVFLKITGSRLRD